MKKLMDEMLELADGDAAKAGRLRVAMEAMMTQEVQVGKEFNATLRSRMMAGVRSSRFSVPRILKYAAVLAVGVGLGAVLFSDGRHAVNPLGGQVAWADVVRAVNEVDHLHITMFADEPRAGKNREKMYRIDWYYQRQRGGGMMRAQGLDAVEFWNGKERKQFSIKEGKWVDLSEQRSGPHLIPEALAKGLGQADMLKLFVQFMFNGEVPTQEPVKNDALATAGIEVFDYMVKAGEPWARVWVVRETRMPMRIKMFHPESDDFSLIEFDYTDPQPAAFFDTAKFEAGVRAIGRLDARIYAVGMEPVSGVKATSSMQINKAVGGYHPPKVREVFANDQGDVVLVASNPKNRTPEGTVLHDELYESVSDNWGNRYVLVNYRFGDKLGEDDCWCFSPTRDFKKGDGLRKLTLSYAIQVVDDRQSGLVWKVLETRTLDVPESSAKGAKAEVWNGLREKDKALRKYYRDTLTLAEQLAMAESGEGVADVLWKFQLMREFGREEAAWKLFEEKLRGQFFEGPVARRSHDSTVAMGQYLVYLAYKKRWDDLREWTERAMRLRAEGLASKDWSLRSWAEHAFRADKIYTSLLAQGVRVEGWLKALEGNEPRVAGVVASKDGYVVVQLKVPTEPEGWQCDGGRGGRDFEIRYGWYWHALPLGGGWQMVGQLADVEQGDAWVAMRRREGSPAMAIRGLDSVKVGGRVTLLRDNQWRVHSRNVTGWDWELQAEIPAASVENMEAWWAKNTAGKNARWYGLPSVSTEVAERKWSDWPVNQWRVEAINLAKEEKWAEAVAVNRKIVEASEDQWPEYERNGMNGPNAIVDGRRRAEVEIVRGLLKLGELAEAKKVIETMRAGLPTKADAKDFQEVESREIVREAEVAYVRELMRLGKVAEAKAELAEIGKNRPDLAEISDKYVRFERMPGIFSTGNLRDKNREAWREVDRVWWELNEE
ncbi:MAG: hypothetical protein FWD53_03710 [Phycisphaerales bacterium]|nr:hypothetical protein [Phycisphaerales bacterium]